MPSILENTIFEKIATQQDFPHQDISKANAGILPIVVANSEVLTTYFTAATQHPSVYSRVPDIFDLIAANRELKSLTATGSILGAQALIAISHLLNPNLENQIGIPSTLGWRGILSIDPLKVASTLTEAANDLRLNLPSTAETIEEIASHHRVDTEAALGGAGVVRRFAASVLQIKA